MGGKAGSAVTGYRYYMTLLFGLCYGPVDYIPQISVGGKFLWYSGGWGSDGTTINHVNTVAQIDQPDIFGGDTGEGGISGQLHVQQGAIDQPVNTTLQSLMGSRLTAFRGYLSAFFDGLITSNNPYPKSWKFRVQRAYYGWIGGTPWYGSKATILQTGWDFQQDQNDSQYDTWFQGQVRAMNGVHIIYECLTNPIWGKGFDTSLMDNTVWEAAADTAYSEGTGFNMIWDRQSPIEDFIGQVVDHLGCAVYQDRFTGLWKIKLIRADYDLGDVPHFTETTGIKAITQDVTTAADTGFNEVIVEFQSPLMDDSRKVREQNAASIAALGKILSTTRSYPGCGTEILAHRLAKRDLLALNATRVFTLLMDRRGYVLQPGDVFTVDLPDRGISNMALRVAKSTVGPITSGEITIDCAADVYDFPLTSFTTYPTPTWQPPNLQPQPVTARYVSEATYRDCMMRLGTGDAEALPEDAGYMSVLAGRPTTVTLNYQLDTSTTDPTVADGTITSTGADWSATSTLDGAINATATAFVLNAITDIGNIAVGDSAYIGNEIVRVDTWDATTQSGTIARGCVDTIPAEHDDGTAFYLIDGCIGTDQVEYIASETLYVKILPRTTQQVLSPTLASVDEIVFNSRQTRPYPPAQVCVDGTSYLSLPVMSDAAPHTFSWVHRNRLLIQDKLLGQLDADAGPIEAGETYTLEIYAANGTTLLRTYAGLTGYSQVYSVADYSADGSPPSIVAKLYAVRDGLKSWQEYSFTISYAARWGGDWGNEWGGS